MNTALDAIILICAITTVVLLSLMLRDVNTTQKAVTAFTNDFYYEIEK